MCLNNNPLNCWKTLKLILLQHKDEINLSAKATKVEKKYEIAQGQNLNAVTMGNQQPSSEQEKVQRLSRKGVGLQAIGSPKWWAPVRVKI